MEIFIINAHILYVCLCVVPNICAAQMDILKIPIFKKLCLDNIQIVDFCFYRALITEVNFLYAY